MSRRLIVVSVFIALALSSSARAELTPEETGAAKALIEKFKDETFGAREKAVADLAEMGPDVIRLVRQAEAASTDAEVKLRCQMVIARLNQRYFIGPDDRVIDLDETARITLKFKDAKIEDVLKAIAEQSGNPEVKVQSRNERCDRITLELEDVPFWDALDAVEREAGVVYLRDWQTQLLAVQSAAPEAVVDGPGAVSGPTVVKLTQISANRQRYFHNPNTIPAQSHLSVSLQCFWEDRLPVLTGMPVITKAVTDDGIELPVPDTSHARYYGIWGNNQGVNGVGFLQVPSETAQSVTFDGVVRLTFGVGFRESRMDDVFAKTDGNNAAKEDLKEEKKADDDWQVNTDSLKMKLSNAVRTDDQAQVAVRGEGKLDCPPLRGGSSLYGFFLICPDGRRVSGQLQLRSTSSSNERFSFEGSWIFSLGEAKEGKYALLYVSPEKTVTKDYPFTLRNVPIP